MAVIYYSLIVAFNYFLLRQSSILFKIGKKRQSILFLVLGVFIVSFYLGIRNINSDFVDYRKYYIHLLHGHAALESRVHEYLYQEFQLFCISLRFDYWIVYSLNVFLMLFPIYYAFIKLNFRPILIALIATLYFVENLYLFGSSLRQMVAIGLVFFALTYKSKTIYAPIIIILIAGLFHRSAFLLIIFPIIFRYIKIPSLKYQVLIVAICYILSFIIINNIDAWVQKIGILLGHGAYAAGDDLDTKMTRGIDFGTYLVIIRYFVVLLSCNFLRKVYRGSLNFELLYKMFFVGICYYFLFINTASNAPLTRANYFQFYIPVIDAIFVYTCFKHAKKNTKFTRIGFVYLLTIIITFYLHILSPFYPGLMPLKFIF